MEKYEWHYLYRDGKNLWIDGVKKRKLPDWFRKIPNNFSGFAEIREKHITLYSGGVDNMQVLKTVRR